MSTTQEERVIPTQTPQAQTTPPERQIRILPPQVVNRIAAGEVVERPASVVKELVENALDAGATRIDVMATAAGRAIRVADNGCGMTPENAALAFYNHATSKIVDVNDLDRIETLGFRGEALASISAISRLTCMTRREDAPRGTKVTIDEQGEPHLQEAGCAPGTIIEVADLFYNTPARLKFLKRAATELGHIEEAMEHLALSHPAVRFSLTLNDKPVLQTSGGNDLRRTIEEVFNIQRENIRLLAAAAEDPDAGLSLAGFVSEPGVMKTSKRWMITFVNNRLVRCPTLQKSIQSAYHSLLPHDRYPLCVLFVGIRPDEVDVNVHPAKREVRYAAPSSIFGFVRNGIRQSMSDQGISLDAPAVPGQGESVSAPFQPRHDTTPMQGSVFHRHEPLSSGSGAARDFPPGDAYTASPYATRPLHLSNPDDVTAAMRFYEPDTEAGQAEISPSPLSALPQGDPPGQTAPPLARFKVIGQLFNTYILLETVQGLMVVDQHIASERAFFEALTLNMTGETPDIQHLVTARPLTVSPTQRALLAQAHEAFARLGFLYELADDSAQLTGFPLIYAGRDGMFESGGLFENLLSQLEETGDMATDLDLLIATLACHSAVRAGDTLSLPEMNAVIERWLACKLPWTCPHGRPIAHTISASELNRFFHRPSLPVNAI